MCGDTCFLFFFFIPWIQFNGTSGHDASTFWMEKSPALKLLANMLYYHQLLLNPTVGSFHNLCTAGGAKSEKPTRTQHQNVDNFQGSEGSNCGGHNS